MTFFQWCDTVRATFGGIDGLVDLYKEIPESQALAREWWEAC